MKTTLSREDAKRILNTYRRMCSKPKEFKLNETEKLLICNIVDVKNFTIQSMHGNLLYYSDWAVPVFIAKNPAKSPNYQGEGFNGNQSHIFNTVGEKIFVETLIAVWEGSVTDLMWIYAAMIESGHLLDILPRLRGGDSMIHRAALEIYQQRHSNDNQKS